MAKAPQQQPANDPPDWAGGPGGKPQPDPAPEFDTYTDTAPVEMRQWDGTEDLTGVGISPEARTIMAAWQGYGMWRPDSYITRHPGDDQRANWWLTPAAVVAERYQKQ